LERFSAIFLETERKSGTVMLYLGRERRKHGKTQRTEQIREKDGKSGGCRDRERK
jgi:hypothetical protein